jgi:phosphate transport system substrate-binding protein
MPKLLVAFSVAVTLLVLPGCARQGGRTHESVQVDGSSTVYPIAEAVAEEFRKAQPGVRATVGFAGTSGGMKKFAAGEIDICNASRPIKDTERDACKAAGIEFVEYQVAYDGLSVAVNPHNDWCDCLTVEQLKALWQPESTVQKWSDLNPDWPNERIQLYGAGTDSGTFEYFTEAIVGEPRRSRSDYSANEDDNVLVTGVAESKYALGYFGYAYYAENQDRLKLVGIDSGDGKCIKPSMETVRDGTYKPLSRPLFIYVSKKSLQRPEVRAFTKFYVENAPQLSVERKYVAVPDAIDAENRRVLQEALAESAHQNEEGKDEG